MNPIHPTLAQGRWRELTLLEQLGNVGSEVGRALRAEAEGESARLASALDRALELFDLTIDDPKNRRRLREICRAREVVCDYFAGGNSYRSTPDSLDQYFLTFALAARKDR